MSHTFLCLKIFIKNTSEKLTTISSRDSIENFIMQTSSSNGYHRTKTDPVQIFDNLNRLYFDFETKINASFGIKQYDAKFEKDSCYITHKGSFYFYGGSIRPNQLSKFDCQKSRVPENSLKFNFTGGTCASNNKNILLCFPIENKRLCYKSNNPSPEKWWQWFSYVELSFATHDAISLSSGNS